MIKYHVYTLLWNDRELIEAFLKHYETAERIVVYDCGSTDGGPEFVLRSGRELRQMPNLDRLDDVANINMKNQVWKESIGKCDFVIVQDTDEFVFFPNHPCDTLKGLQSLKEQGVTACRVESYSAVTSDQEWLDLISLVKKGHNPCVGLKRIARGDLMPGNSGGPFLYDKPLIFNPNIIVETDFCVGQHDWTPKTVPGKTLSFPKKPVWMLHYRFIGETYEFQRMRASRERLRHQFASGCGVQYDKTDEQILEAIASIHSDKRLFDFDLAYFKDIKL